MKETHLRVLAIGGDPDRVQLLEETFGEMAELCFSRSVFPACQREYALDWQEALGQIGQPEAIAPDAILLDISDGTGAATPAAFGALRAVAPAAAIIVIACRQDELAALALIRLGAQDYLLDTEIDCEPLARLLRSAVERSRLSWSRQSVSMIDDLTGLYNEHGARLLAERDSRLASALHLHRWALDVHMDSSASPDRDLQRLELAEQLSGLSSAGLLAARTNRDTFAVFGLAQTSLAAGAIAAETARKIGAQCGARGISVSVSLATVSRGAGLACENR